jgi:polysaccharide export outer membrane protein
MVTVRSTTHRPRWRWSDAIGSGVGRVVSILLVFACLLPQAGAQDNSDSTYRLGAGDRVKIAVFGQADLSGEYLLDGQGVFSMPLIGKIDASDMSVAELEVHVVDRLQPDYLVHPRVSVQVLNYRPFYIIGEVNNPDSYHYVDGMTYLNAVAIAGGFTYRAKRDDVYVIRADSETRDEIKVDIDDEVQPGDIIRIAERFF